MHKNIYVAQFETGSNINLLPLAAGQLVSRLKLEDKLLEEYNLNEILFVKEEPSKLVSKIDNVSIMGLSGSLWNMNQNLAFGKEVKNKFPDSLIVFGGPSVPRNEKNVDKFLMDNGFIDVVCLDEGEEVFTQLCKNYQKKDFKDIEGIAYRDKGKIIKNPVGDVLLFEKLPSPFLDGSFDKFYEEHKSRLSGIILEVNRGCPYKCSFCTWGADCFKKVRSKSKQTIENEVEWVGKNKINYISMADANFGIKQIDVDFTGMLAKCKEKYGFPNHITVSWVKNKPERVLEIADKLRKANIGFKITSALQSLNEKALKASNRWSIKKQNYDKIRRGYRKHNLYSYTELILGLPEETHDSYVEGIEKSLSPSIFDQIYSYPLLLYSNTQMSTKENRKKYGIESRIIESAYTKSKSFNKIRENMEIVIGTSAMPKDKWIDSFVIGYHTLALHDDRLAFFPLNYFKKEFDIKITDLIKYARQESEKSSNYPVIRNSFSRLEDCASNMQKKSRDQLIRPVSYGGMPFDPPEGVFLELILDKKEFYSEFLDISKSFLNLHKINYNETKLNDLFKFQDAVMASPQGPCSEYLDLKYDWINYFSSSFNLPEKKLEPKEHRLKIADDKPCYGHSKVFLKSHFDVRGVPPINLLYDETRKLVFPPVKMPGIN